MERSTTEAPWWDNVYEAEYFNFTELEPYVFTPRVVHERLVAFAVLALFAIISSLCVLVTVIRTTSVRSQLLGVMLINLALAVLLHDVILAREMESEARGGVGNFGTVGCNFYYFAYTVSGFVIHATIIIICIDTTFSLPRSRIVQIIVTVCVWVLAIICTAINLYGFGEGPTVYKEHGENRCVVNMKGSHLMRVILDLFLYSILPTIPILVTFVRFCCIHSTNKSTEGKKLPFVLTALIYLVTIWALPVVTHFYIPWLSSFSGYFWVYMTLEFMRVVILLIWLFLIADLRNKCLCREAAAEESSHLLK